MRITAYQIAKERLLRGTSGKVLTNVDYVRALIAKPGLFTTYEFKATKTSPRGSHTVETTEIEEWNRKILAKIEEQSKKLNSIRPGF